MLPEGSEVPIWMRLGWRGSRRRHLTSAAATDRPRQIVGPHFGGGLEVVCAGRIPSERSGQLPLVAAAGARVLIEPGAGTGVGIKAAAGIDRIVVSPDGGFGGERGPDVDVVVIATGGGRRTSGIDEGSRPWAGRSNAAAGRCRWGRSSTDARRCPPRRDRLGLRPTRRETGGHRTPPCRRAPRRRQMSSLTRVSLSSSCRPRARGQTSSSSASLRPSAPSIFST